MKERAKNLITKGILKLTGKTPEETAIFEKVFAVIMDDKEKFEEAGIVAGITPTGTDLSWLVRSMTRKKSKQAMKFICWGDKNTIKTDNAIYEHNGIIGNALGNKKTMKSLLEELDIICENIQKSVAKTLEEESTDLIYLDSPHTKKPELAGALA